MLFTFLSFATGIYLVCIIIWANIPYSYIGSNFLYRQGAYGHLNMRLKEIPEYGEVDILFVGSSRVYRGFDPRIFEKSGYKVFVLGSSGQTPLQSYVLLRRYLDDLKPKLIVFDVLPSSFAIKGVEPTLDLLANDRIDSLNLKMAVEQNDIIVWNTLIYASLMEALGSHDDFEERKYKPEENDTYISGGYVHKELRFHKNINCELLGAQYWKAPASLQLKYFEKIRLLCAEAGIKVIFINMPLADYDCYKNNAEAFNSIGVDSLIDLNIELEFNDSLHFYDNFHLNELGVEKLNQFTLQHLL